MYLKAPFMLYNQVFDFTAMCPEIFSKCPDFPAFAHPAFCASPVCAETATG
jgi:hypothetical protein